MWFDFRTKRVALSHYLQFGPAGYERLRESSLETLPSQRTNERTLSHLRGGSGCHVVKFAAQFVDVMRSSRKNKEEEIVAQVIFDELKIKYGVVYNPKTGIPTGITASKNNKSMCFAEEILDLANDSLVLSTPDIDTIDQSLEKDDSNKLGDDTNLEHI